MMKTSGPKERSSTNEATPVTCAFRNLRAGTKQRGKNNTTSFGKGPRVELRLRVSDTLGVALEARREVYAQATGALPSLSLTIETLLRERMGLPVPAVEMKPMEKRKPGRPRRKAAGLS